MRFIGFLLVLLSISGVVVLGFGRIPRPEPPTGMYRIRDVADEPFSPGRSNGRGGLVAKLEVEYAGPRAFAEFVLENWEGPVLVSSTTLMRMRFGKHSAGMLVKSAPSREAGSGSPSTSNRETFTVLLSRLPDATALAENAIGMIQVEASGDSSDGVVHRSMRVDAMGDRCGSSLETRPDLPYPIGTNRCIADGSPAVIWQCSTVVDPCGCPGIAPPFPERARVSRIAFRFVEEESGTRDPTEFTQFTDGRGSTSFR